MLDCALTGLLDLFSTRVLSFDTEAARCYSGFAETARQNGRGFPTPDGYIAAIAASKDFIVATRDTSAFVAAGLRVINPWQEDNIR